jgi:hypothetical protein
MQKGLVIKLRMLITKQKPNGKPADFMDVD